MGRFFEVTPLRKIGIGLFVTAIAFAIPSLVQQSIDAGGAPHIAWQFLAYALMTAAEVMVSITGLEFSYTQAPRKMKSFVMGVFLLVDHARQSVHGPGQWLHRRRKKRPGNTFLEGANYYLVLHRRHAGHGRRSS